MRLMRKKKERETTIKEKWAGECQLIFLLKGWLSTGRHSEGCRADQVGREKNGASLGAEPLPLTLRVCSFSRATWPQTLFILEAPMAQPRPLAWKQAVTQLAQQPLPARSHTGSASPPTAWPPPHRPRPPHTSAGENEEATPAPQTWPYLSSFN